MKKLYLFAFSSFMLGTYSVKGQTADVKADRLAAPRQVQAVKQNTPQVQNSERKVLTADRANASSNVQPVIYKGEPKLRNAERTAPVNCDSLTTTYAGGNGNSGIMFNIQALQTSVITGFHVSIDQTAGDTVYMKIYYRKGTYIGNETTPSAWTFIDSVLVLAGGTGVPVYVPINTSIVIPTGQKYGFYVTTNSSSTLDYTNGTNEDSVYVANSFIQIREGRGMGYPFITSGVPRVFNGSVHFCPEISTSCDTINTTYAAGNGQSGAMFDITATQDIILKKLYAGVDGEGWMKIYYRDSSYAGNQNNASAWTFLDSAYVSPRAAQIPTLINIALDIPVSAGDTIALYVTGNNTGIEVDYTNGTTEGNVFVSDANIQIREGRGVQYPFGQTYTPRVFNGTIDYCLETATSVQSLSTMSTSLYPNPFSDEATLKLSQNLDLSNTVLRIYDILGNQVKSMIVSSHTLTIKKGNELSSGMYIFRVENAKGTAASGRFIIQ